jgi:hypothetical protein
LALINQILVAISSHFPEILGFKFNEVETIAVVVPNKLIYLGHWDGRVNTSGAKSRGIRMYRDWVALLKSDHIKGIITNNVMKVIVTVLMKQLTDIIIGRVISLVKQTE